jgi:formylglycine-generating enzyme required for sulfatase activity
MKREAPWDDGYPYHAPVGTFLPNAFGLHDVCGNLCELCQEGMDPKEAAQQPDPLFAGLAKKTRFMRGGSYGTPISESRIICRRGHDMSFRGHLIGVRPAASLD